MDTRQAVNRTVSHPLGKLTTFEMILFIWRQHRLSCYFLKLSGRALFHLATGRFQRMFSFHGYDAGFPKGLWLTLALGPNVNTAPGGHHSVQCFAGMDSRRAA